MDFTLSCNDQGSHSLTIKAASARSRPGDFGKGIEPVGQDQQTIFSEIVIGSLARTTAYPRPSWPRTRVSHRQFRYFVLWG